MHSCIFLFSNSKEYQDCLIVAIKGNYNPKPVAWLFQKHSPYMDIFDFYKNELIEKGTWNAIQHKYDVNPQVCPNLSGKPIGFTTCFTAFLFLIGGVSLALMIMFLEHLHKKYKSKKLNILLQNIQNPTKELKIQYDSKFKQEEDQTNTKHMQLFKVNQEKLKRACMARGLGSAISWTINQNSIHFVIKRD